MQNHKSTQINSIEGAKNWKSIQNFGRHFPNSTKKIYSHILTEISRLFIIHKHKMNTHAFLQTLHVLSLLTMPNSLIEELVFEHKNTHYIMNMGINIDVPKNYFLKQLVHKILKTSFQFLHKIYLHKQIEFYQKFIPQQLIHFIKHFMCIHK